MSASLEIKVPDIGDFDEVEIIEVLVAEGQSVAAEDPLITLESDKATMDIPAPSGGVIEKLLVQVGQKVAQGAPIALLRGEDAAAEPATKPSKSTDKESGKESKQESDKAASKPARKESSKAADKTPSPESSAVDTAKESAVESPPKSTTESSAPSPTVDTPQVDGELPHASPSVRQFARELGAQLALIKGSGRKGRILREDVSAWVKQQLTSPPSSSSSASGIPPIKPIDFSQFGAIERVALSRIKKLSGPHLQRAWLNAPHVTHHDEADVTELEAFRQSLKEEAARDGVRITMLGFAVKVLANALKKFPQVNASLDADGATLIVKQYFNIGIAVDTPNGLVVPVIREVDRKSIFEIAKSMGELSARARDGKLTPADMQGGCITISSLGGIGGTAFTPIINAPEIAILGITRARLQPVWDGKKFAPRLMLPLDFSYDHRAIDGAEAARFVAHLVQSFGDARRLSL